MLKLYDQHLLRTAWRMMRAVILAAAVIVVNCVAASAQRRPAFEVAAIKPNISGTTTFHLSAHQPIGNLFTAQNVTVRKLVLWAYNLSPRQISGAPDWFNLEHYDVEAKPERPSSQDEIYSMVRTLLADRFRLVMHRERKDLPVYNLVLEKGGHR